MQFTPLDKTLPSEIEGGFTKQLFTNTDYHSNFQLFFKIKLACLWEIAYIADDQYRHPIPAISLTYLTFGIPFPKED